MCKDPFFMTDRELIDEMKDYGNTQRDKHRLMNELIDRTGIDPSRYADEDVGAFDAEQFFEDAERLLGLDREEEQEGGVDNGCEVKEDVQ